MKVLVACEFSGIVREAFRARGHDAISCDLLPTEIPGPHYEGNVLHILNRDKWDLIIAHPPCTYLANSGAQWLYKKPGRWELMVEGAQFFKAILNAECPRIAVENPVMHKHAKELIGVNYSQIIQPWQFGHPETKGTCLWLKGLPDLQPTNIIKDQMLKNTARHKIWMMGESMDRWKERSRTYQGIADAMADQWGGFVEDELSDM